MAFSLLYNAPKFFEFTTVYVENKNRYVNMFSNSLISRESYRKDPICPEFLLFVSSSMILSRFKLYFE